MIQTKYEIRIPGNSSEVEFSENYGEMEFSLRLIRDPAVEKLPNGS